MILNIGINLKSEGMSLIYGDGVFFPKEEYRRLADIRPSLIDKHAVGPEIVYSIAMDVGRIEDREDLLKRNLLFGVCVYSKGRIGNQPVYSQGHIHSVSKSCGSSTPELYEILSGKGIVCMQEPAGNRFYAITAKTGDKVLVPPGWPHCTINASENEHMIFGAWCVRDYGFEYEYVRKQGGLAYHPIFAGQGGVSFIHNDNYSGNEIVIKPPEAYCEFRIETSTDLYTQYINDKDRFDFVADPGKAQPLWENFTP